MKRLTTTLLASAAVAPSLLGDPAFAQDPVLRVGLSKVCPSDYDGSNATSEALPAIAVALLGNAAMQLTSSLIDDITTYLEKKPATTLDDVYPADVFLQTDGKGKITIADSAQCVWVAASASFVPPTIKPLGGRTSGSKALTYSDEDLHRLVPFDVTDRKVFLSMTGAREPVVFYFEARVAMSSTAEAWRLAPKKMYYPTFIAQSNAFQSRAHDVAFTIQYSNPGQDNQPFATFSITKTDLQEGTLPAQVVGKNLAWMKVPTDKPPTAAESGGYAPVNVRAQLVETRKPNELADAMAKALGAKKSDIATAVGDKVSYALSAQTRADAAVAATTTLKTANDAYNTAYTSAKDAMSKYDDAQKGNDDSAKALALNNARVASLVLAHATGAARDAAAAAGSQFTPAPDPTKDLPKA
ncbi:hypothetical protein [Paraburkholderia lycopersici]|uniref:Uncharacterized protein n=1 Tax=Paraburkholderia lycopersici TaxID=416944 RepID=A0A1G6LVA4_9BURK|nr:hypothetical protein [Paraburkholderia lycopersici]SDC46984.1 hypothetical protein SAMN05421548_10747 [Paraburkholderia lycopersici]